ncbi:MAG: hypothetical protein ACRDSL_05410 [Pseudonocardiaceae bacterium]
MIHSQCSIPSVLKRTPTALLAGVLILALAACGTPAADTADSPTAQQVVTKLAQRIPTVTPGQVFTAETDPHHLLGRPGGYLSKASFFDNRIDPNTASASQGGIQRGGSVEAFADEHSAQRRMEHLQTLGPPFGEEYHYVSGPVLVRVANALTPGQASEYATALAEIVQGG